MTLQNNRTSYSDKMGSIFFKGMEEVIGQKAVNEALDSANLVHLVNNYPPHTPVSTFHLDKIGYVQTALERLYGIPGSQGLALRSGRASFKHGLREFGAQLGWTEKTFRLLPLNTKLRTAARLFAGSLNTVDRKRVQIEENPTHLFLHIEHCPICWGRHSGTATCHLAVGVLQEALYWISSGKYFDVRETDCIAKGDPRCSMVIQKKPLE
jgi:predicted hydrocarbon binding protein